MESCDYSNLKAEVEDLRYKLHMKDFIIKHLLCRLREFSKENRKVGGRPSKFSAEEISEIRKCRHGGMSIPEIARKFNCSVGLIHKLVCENSENSKQVK